MISQVAFENVANAVGAEYAYGDTTFGGGVSFVDFDNDGWDDLTYATEAGKEIYFLKNNNGVYTSISLNGISNTFKTKQVLWVDYDNDGDKDFFVTAFNGVNKFYKNDGNMNFTDISSTIGFFQTDLFSYSISLADIDNDGDLDAFITNRDITEIQRNYLYRNDSGVYVDITVSAGISLISKLSFCSIFFDYNKDGYQDIYVSNDKSFINRLYKNKGDGTFEDVSVSSGAGIMIDAMSTTLGDYNNDGWFDIYVTNSPGGNQLLKNNGDGTFTDTSALTHTTFNSVGWSAVFLDADNDALLDLYVSGSIDASFPTLLPSAFYHQQSNGTFIIPSSIGFANDNKVSYSNAIGDINNDGKPDIVVGNDTDPNFLWENKSTNTNNWIKIKLEGVTSNRDGIGNEIEVFANGKSQYRYTLCSEGYLGQNSNYEFIGVSSATIIDYIKVKWNTTGQVETINNVQANQAITIKEGNGILSSPQEELSNFSIYPNPGNDGVFYFSTVNNQSYQITIYDLSGRYIFSKKYLVGSTTNIINLKNFSKGIYTAKIISGKNSKAVKLIIE